MSAPTAQDVKRFMSNAESSIGTSRFDRELMNVLDSYLDDYEKRALETHASARYEFKESDYKQFKNVPIRDLINDSYFLGLDEEMFPIHKEELELVSTLWLAGEIEEVVNIAAMGVGKTYAMSGLAWLIAYYTVIEPIPAEVYGLDPKTKLGISIISKTGTLAKEVTYMQMLPFFDCGFFNDYFPPQVNIAKVEDTRRYPKQLRFPKGLTIFPGTTAAEAVRGHNIIASLMDEFAWMEKILKSRRNTYIFGGGFDAAEDAYTTASNRMFSRVPTGRRRPLIAMLTSPRSKFDFAEDKYEQGLKHPAAPQSTYREEDDATITGIETETGMILGRDGTIDLDALKRGEGRKVISLRRKPLWRGRPQKWKGSVNWCGKYVLFDCDNMKFVSDRWHEGLFDSEDDFDEHGFLKVPIEALKQFMDSPESAVRDIGAVASGGINRFFRELAKITTSREHNNYLLFKKYNFFFDKEFKLESVNNPTATRYLHVDMGLETDACGVACCHISNWASGEEYSGTRPVFTFDFYQELLPEPGKQFRISGLYDLIVELKEERGFDIGCVTFDRFQSAQSIQDLWEDYSIPAGLLSIDRTTHRVLLPAKLSRIKTSKDYKTFLQKAGAQQMYGTLRESLGGNNLAPWFDYRNALYEKRVILPYYARANFNLMFQMEQEEYYPVERKIDHPPKGTHDGLQAVVGAFWNTLNNEWYGKGYAPEYEKDDSVLVNTIKDIEREMALNDVSEDQFMNFMKRRGINFPVRGDE